MKQQGLTLIEVLIAVLVLAIGLLGIAGLQSSALSNNFISYQYTQASILAQSMAERMRANRQGILDGRYRLTAGSAPTAAIDCSSGGCTAPADQANWDMAVWYSQITGTAVANAPLLVSREEASRATGAMPNSAASISCSSDPRTAMVCTVTVYWDPSRALGPNNPNLYSCDAADDGAMRCFRLVLAP